MLDGGWRFGPYELHAGMGLRRGAKIIALTDVEMQLLTILAREGGEIVARETLLESVWSRRMTDDNVLSTSIHRLRRQLGEDMIPASQQGGYRLGCVPESLETEPELEARMLCAIFLEAEKKRQRMPDAEWDRIYLGRADRVRACLDWGLAVPGRKHIVIRLGGASGRIWERLSAIPEGRGYLERAVALLDGDVRPADAARVLRYAGVLWKEADRPRALALFQRAASLYRELKDKQNLGTVLGLIGDAQLFLGRHEDARVALKEAEKLLSISDQSKALWNVLNGLGILAAMRKTPLEAMHYFGSARDLARLLDDELREYIIVLNIGELEFGEGAIDRAIERASEAVRGLDSAPAMYRVRPIVNLATYQAVAGVLRQSRKAAMSALPLAAEEGGHWLRLCLQVWAFLAAFDGRYVDAARLLGFSEAQFVRIGETRDASEQVLYDRLTLKLAENLMPGSIEVWRSEGAAWSEARAVKYVKDNLASSTRSRSRKGV
jgi:tetratricopeptide (TPR) repeat protein